MKRNQVSIDNLEGFIRVKRLSQLLEVSRSTIWRMEKSGVLPPRVSITGSRSVGWRVGDIKEFLENRRPAKR